MGMWLGLESNAKGGMQKAKMLERCFALCILPSAFRLRFFSSLLGLAAASIALSGCESPEATRTRGGGPGADGGNRPVIVKMHEGSRQYWETPVLIPGESVSLQPANHARQISQP